MHRLPYLLLLLLGVLLPAAARAVEPAGTVTRVQGSATATMSNGFARTLYVESTVLVGDRLQTASGARLQIRLSDGATVTLGEDSEMTIEVYGRAEDDGLGVLKAVSGAFLAASGALAKLGPDRMTIETPSAVLGVRGTEVWGRIRDETSVEVALLSGTGVVVLTPEGTADMTEPGTGLTVGVGTAPPAPTPWSAERLAAAAASVAFDGD
ncbi:MAG: FecR family protein [Rhodospirillales bacterium]